MPAINSKGVVGLSLVASRGQLGREDAINIDLRPPNHIYRYAERVQSSIHPEDFR